MLPSPRCSSMAVTPDLHRVSATPHASLQGPVQPGSVPQISTPGTDPGEHRRHPFVQPDPHARNCSIQEPWP